MLLKIKALIALLCFAASSVFAFDLEITNDPNKEFFIGYTKKYGSNCEIQWWASRWETEHLMSSDECQGITHELVYKDLIAEMKKVRKISKAENFADYYREQEKAKKAALEHRFCLDKIDYVLIFSGTEVPNKEGWNLIFYSKYSRYGSIDRVVGSWRKLNKTHVQADFGKGLVTVDKSQAISC